MLPCIILSPRNCGSEELNEASASKMVKLLTTSSLGFYMKLLKQGCLGQTLLNHLMMRMMVIFPGKWYQIQKPVRGTDGILSTKEETN